MINTNINTFRAFLFRKALEVLVSIGIICLMFWGVFKATRQEDDSWIGVFEVGLACLLILMMFRYLDGKEIKKIPITAEAITELRRYKSDRASIITYGVVLAITRLSIIFCFGYAVFYVGLSGWWWVLGVMLFVISGDTPSQKTWRHLYRDTVKNKKPKQSNELYSVNKKREILGFGPIDKE